MPFNVHFEQDTTLQDILLAEAPGILRWAMEGLKQWRKHGLMEPQAVLDATTGYRAEEDVLLRFIQGDYLEIGGEHKCGAHDLHETYKKWAHNNHEEELSERKFSDSMKAHGYKKLPHHEGHSVRGHPDRQRVLRRPANHEGRRKHVGSGFTFCQQRWENLKSMQGHVGSMCKSQRKSLFLYGYYSRTLHNPTSLH